MPELCEHDEPSQCSPECAKKADAFDAWVKAQVSAERQTAYGELLKIAAELARCSYMPSEYDDDHSWYRSTPIAERRRILEENEKACNHSRELAMRLRRAADKLLKGVS